VGRTGKRSHVSQYRVIDKAPQASTLSKALAIQAHTLEVFEGIGIVDQFAQKRSRPTAETLPADGKRILHFSFDSIPAVTNTH
jgi:2-polyprenyl-6-methoxyphenol hydroxylase-like FAD-dependent oxidoreductase